MTVPVTILQLNAEGLTRAKRDLIRHFTDKHDANVLLIPETHIYDVAELSIGGLSLTDHVPDKHGDDIDATLTKKSASESSVESTTIKVNSYYITNVFKPFYSSIDSGILYQPQAPSPLPVETSAVGAPLGATPTPMLAPP
mgnify:CR=1 FL=1